MLQLAARESVNIPLRYGQNGLSQEPHMQHFFAGAEERRMYRS